MTQPEPVSWSGAVQRELDGLRRSVDTRVQELTNRLDKLLTLSEYNADKRLSDLQYHTLQEKLDDAESDNDTLRNEIRTSVTELRREIAAERAKYETALADEVRNRQTDHNAYVQQRQSQFRWTVSMVMIPIAIALVQLFLHK